MMRYPLLYFQGFFCENLRIWNRHRTSLLPAMYSMSRNMQHIYPITWGKELQETCFRIACGAWEMQRLDNPRLQARPTVYGETYDSLEEAQRPAALSLKAICIGGHHTLLLVTQYQAANSTDYRSFGRTMRTGLAPPSYYYETKVYMFGWNDRGQLGRPKGTRLLHPEDATAEKQPLQFLDREYGDSRGRYADVLLREVDYSATVAHVAVGDDHCLALSGAGKIFTWGDNSHGQCGHGHNELRIHEPRIVEELREVYVTA
eukprot:GHVU01035542.1.p2 GENE.GHVU01035542.1~~GHVU01035542.1.p2  ORF type:complete len:260 (+),score=35.78 GHVU01035542.1:319-1098(+)